MRPNPLFLVLFVVTSAACGTAPEGSDAGSGLDAGDVTPDAGEITPDAGDVTPDAGDATPDAGSGPLDWETVGLRNFVPGGVSEPFLTVSATGKPYVAFSDNAQAGKTSVMTLDEGAWVYVGTPGLAELGNNRFPNVVLHDGQPWVTYQQNVPGNKAWVQRFNGTSWSVVGGAAVSAGEAAFPSLAFDSAGTPHVAYRDNANGGKTTVMKFDGTSWVAVGSVGISSAVAWFQTLAFDGLTPYVAYASVVNENPVNVTVQKFSEGAWSLVGPERISATAVGYIDFAVHDGTPYLFYGGKAKTDATELRRFNGTNWETVGSIGRKSLDTGVGLVFGNGTPYIAFKDWDNTSFAPSVMAFDGTAWNYVGASNTTGSNDDSISLGFGGGRLFLGFRDATSNPKSLSVIHIGR